MNVMSRLALIILTAFTIAISALAQAAPKAGPEGNLAADDYRLSSQDLITFHMVGQPDLDTTQRLTRSGDVTLPLLGSVNVGGKTLRMAQADLNHLYVKDGYFIHPQVILSVKEYGAHYVTVLGQVKRPERIQIPQETDSIGILEAITQAGGFTRIAKTDQVQVSRRTGSGGDRRITVNVDKFLGQSGAEGQEFQLHPGDVVFVPERAF